MDGIKKYLSMVNKDILKIKVKRRAQKRVCISFVTIVLRLFIQ